MTLNEWAKEVYELAKQKGWWDSPRTVPELLCLIHSEISEALEAYRNRQDDKLAEELIDAIIRILDLAAHFSIDVDAELLKKHNYNKTRPYRHGNKRC